MLNKKNVKSVNQRTWFTKGMLVLTSDGWLPIEEVLTMENVQIATLDEKGVMVFQSLLEYSIFEHKTKVRRFVVQRRSYLFKKVYVDDCSRRPSLYTIRTGEGKIIKVNRKSVKGIDYDSSLYSFVIPSNIVFVRNKNMAKPNTLKNVIAIDVTEEEVEVIKEVLLKEDRLFDNDCDRLEEEEIIINEENDDADNEQEDVELDVYDYYNSIMQREDMIDVPVLEIPKDFSVDNCIMVYCQEPDHAYKNIDFVK